MSLDGELLQNLAALPVEKRAITNPRVLNEAYDYAKPSSFSRGMRIDLNGLTILLISGTASIDEDGRSVHIGDFRAQQRRTYQNITGLLEAEGATWHDIVRTTCYLRDIERDYTAFNEERTEFFRQQELDPVPASTGIQAILCRPELLIEIEAIAIFRTNPKEYPESFRQQDLDPVPASTGIQAILCRPELLIEIEAIAIFRTNPKE